MLCSVGDQKSNHATIRDASALYTGIHLTKNDAYLHNESFLEILNHSTDISN